MQSVRVTTQLFLSARSTLLVQAMGLKSHKIYPKPKNIEFPDKPKLKMMEKVPIYGNIRPFKMQKRLRYMRGAEEVHNELIHKQYGIIATGGGRLNFRHFEMIRSGLYRALDYEKSFAVWRVSAPWQPLTKKPKGIKLGGGKGAIDRYVTPVKAGRVIVEVGGYIEYFEVQRALEHIASKLPFKAMAVSAEILEEKKKLEKQLEEENINPWTWKYMIQNRMAGCYRWVSRFDKKWFNKYI